MCDHGLVPGLSLLSRLTIHARHRLSPCTPHGRPAAAASASASQTSPASHIIHPSPLLPPFCSIGMQAASFLSFRAVLRYVRRKLTQAVVVINRLIALPVLGAMRSLFSRWSVTELTLRIARSAEPQYGKAPPKILSAGTRATADFRYFHPIMTTDWLGRAPMVRQTAFPRSNFLLAAKLRPPLKRTRHGRPAPSADVLSYASARCTLSD